MACASQVPQDGGFKEPWGLRSSICFQGTLYLSTFHKAHGQSHKHMNVHLVDLMHPKEDLLT